MMQGDAVQTSLVDPNGCEHAQDTVEKPMNEQQPSMRQALNWMLLGLGCTWFLGDSTNLETAWWIDSQPEGDKIGGYIALCGTLAPINALLVLALRAFAPKTFAQGVVPIMIVMSLISGYLLASNLWTITSWVIYIAVFLNQTVGAMVPFSIVPWVISQGYMPSLLSFLYLGGSVGSLSASILSMVQEPGSAKRFSPSIFFLIITTPVFMSLFAYARIVRKRIGAMQEPDENYEAAPRHCWSGMFANFGTWWATTLPLALVSSLMAMGSWTILRAALPFAATHTTPGHAACAPHCDSYCSAFSQSMCSTTPACLWSSDNGICQEDRGAIYVQWAVSLAQWAFALGIATTVVMPSMRIYIVPAFWLLPFLLICAMAADKQGTFEFKGAGELLVIAQLLVRLCQGYFEVMLWRYLVWRVGPDAEAATLFCGFVMQVMGSSLGGAVSAGVTALGIFSD